MEVVAREAEPGVFLAAQRAPLLRRAREVLETLASCCSHMRGTGGASSSPRGASHGVNDGVNDGRLQLAQSTAAARRTLSSAPVSAAPALRSQERGFLRARRTPASAGVSPARPQAEKLAGSRGGRLLPGGLYPKPAPALHPSSRSAACGQTNSSALLVPGSMSSKLERASGWRSSDFGVKIISCRGRRRGRARQSAAPEPPPLPTNSRACPSCPPPPASDRELPAEICSSLAAALQEAQRCLPPPAFPAWISPGKRLQRCQGPASPARPQPQCREVKAGPDYLSVPPALTSLPCPPSAGRARGRPSLRGPARSTSCTGTTPAPRGPCSLLARTQAACSPGRGYAVTRRAREQTGCSVLPRTAGILNRELAPLRGAAPPAAPSASCVTRSASLLAALCPRLLPRGRFAARTRGRRALASSRVKRSRKRRRARLGAGLLVLTGLRKGRRIWRRRTWKKLAGVEQFTTIQLQSYSWRTSKSSSFCLDKHSSEGFQKHECLLAPALQPAGRPAARSPCLSSRPPSAPSHTAHRARSTWAGCIFVPWGSQELPPQRVTALLGTQQAQRQRGCKPWHRVQPLCRALPAAAQGALTKMPPRAPPGAAPSHEC